MKKSILNIGKTLSKSELQEVNGSRNRPCGTVGGTPTNHSQQRCWEYGFLWINGVCWICY